MILSRCWQWTEGLSYRKCFGQEIRQQNEMGDAVQFALSMSNPIESSEAANTELRPSSEPEQVTPDGVLLEGVTSPLVALSAEVSVIKAAQDFIESRVDLRRCDP